MATNIKVTVLLCALWLKHLPFTKENKMDAYYSAHRIIFNDTKTACCFTFCKHNICTKIANVFIPCAYSPVIEDKFAFCATDVEIRFRFFRTTSEFRTHSFKKHNAILYS